GGRLAELADAGAQGREDVRVADAVLLRLPVLLFCRAGIGHRELPGRSRVLASEGRRQIAPVSRSVNAGLAWGNCRAPTGFPRCDLCAARALLRVVTQAAKAPGEPLNLWPLRALFACLELSRR